MNMIMTPNDIAAAWYSVTDQWFTRQNKMRKGAQWEVVHDWGGELISDDTMRVVDVFHTLPEAEDRARMLEDEARGEAVLRTLNKRT